MRIDVVLLALALLGVLIWMGARQHRAAVRQRAEIFEDCLPLLEEARLDRSRPDFPTLTGRYRGQEVRIEPVLDSVAFRKLPSLWLLVTVKGPTAYRGSFDLLMRPQNIEFYALSSRLEQAVEPPPGWPEHAAIRTDDPQAMPPAERIRPHLEFFDDPRAKEMAVTPRGVRLVYQLAQAARGNYLVMREIRFDNIRVAPPLLQSLLERAHALYSDMRGERGADEAGSRQV